MTPGHARPHSPNGHRVCFLGPAVRHEQHVLKPQPCLVSRLWGPGVRVQGAGRMGSSWGRRENLSTSLPSFWQLPVPHTPWLIDESTCAPVFTGPLSPAGRVSRFPSFPKNSSADGSKPTLIQYDLIIPRVHLQRPYLPDTVTSTD